MSGIDPVKEALAEPTGGINVSQVIQTGKDADDALMAPFREHVSKHEEEKAPEVPALSSGPATIADAAAPSTSAAAAPACAPSAAVTTEHVDKDVTGNVATGADVEGGSNVPALALTAEEVAAVVASMPKKRGRPAKVSAGVVPKLAVTEDSVAPAAQPVVDADGASAPAPSLTPKKRGRPPKAGGGVVAKEKSGRPRGRPPKNAVAVKEKSARPRGRPPKKAAAMEGKSARPRGRPPKKAAAMEGKSAKPRGRPPKKAAAIKAAAAAGAGGVGPPAKKRGRPPKVGGAVEKKVAGAVTGSGKKRGRPKGSKNVKTKEKPASKAPRGRPPKKQKTVHEVGGGSLQPKGTVSLSKGRPSLGKAGTKSKVVVGLLESGRLTSEPASGEKAENEQLDVGKEQPGTQPKKRGRPPKAKTGAKKDKKESPTPGTGKRRGRPPKSVASGEGAEKEGEAKPGRPPVVKTTDAGEGGSTAPVVVAAAGGDAAIKKRGRPRKDSKPTAAAAVS